MPYHRYKIDQTVVSSASTVPSGRYTILRLMPVGQAEPRYLIRRIVDGFESLVLEGQIRLLEADKLSPGRQLRLHGVI
jgi:hypothetical protein